MTTILAVGRRVAGAGLCALLMAAAGCSGDPVDPLAPPEIRYGEDVCDQCGMAIDDPRYAAATVVDEGGALSPRRFDDIGDMILYHADRPELTVARWYVHDFATGEWLDAAAASFVRASASAIPSPMGFGVIAFADAEAARAEAEARGGTMLDFDGLRAAIAADGPVPSP